VVAHHLAKNTFAEGKAGPARFKEFTDV